VHQHGRATAIVVWRASCVAVASRWRTFMQLSGWPQRIGRSSNSEAI
jgi:hypothetical protein